MSLSLINVAGRQSNSNELPISFGGKIVKQNKKPLEQSIGIGAIAALILTVALPAQALRKERTTMSFSGTFPTLVGP